MRTFWLTISAILLLGLASGLGWWAWRRASTARRLAYAAVAGMLLVVGSLQAWRVAAVVNLRLSDAARLTVISAGLLAVALVAAAGARRITRYRLRPAFTALSGLLLLTGGGLFWYAHRPLPAVITDQALFDGIVYNREIYRQPRPMIFHIVTVDLQAPGISFLVTPGEPVSPGERPQRRQLRARTTSQFLQEFGLQLAINGGGFEPFHSNSPLDYYPRAGDPVDVIGFASSRGVIYSPSKTGQSTFYISEDNRVSIDAPIGPVYNALNSGRILLRNAKIVRQNYDDDILRPRTAVGYDLQGERLIIVLVDGRQPNYSEGSTVAELIAVFRKYGGANVVALDGGGSTTLVIEGADGEPIVLNSPIHAQIPGLERPVANHLGIYAQRLNVPNPESPRVGAD